MNSLLEKYYPKAPVEDQNSDIQSQLEFLKEQVQILQNKLYNQEFENVQLKQQLNTIQANIAENNEPIQTQQAVQQWEYKSDCFDDKQATKLGEEGWEAYGYDNGVTVFKLPKPTKKRPTPGYSYGR